MTFDVVVVPDQPELEGEQVDRSQFEEANVFECSNIW